VKTTLALNLTKEALGFRGFSRIPRRKAKL
jgi:hypothetical protein